MESTVVRTNFIAFALRMLCKEAFRSNNNCLHVVTQSNAATLWWHREASSGRNHFLLPLWMSQVAPTHACNIIILSMLVDPSDGVIIIYILCTQGVEGNNVREAKCKVQSFLI